MHCPDCHYESAAGARFCGGCGRSLPATRSCPACATENAPGHRFCSGCGELLAPRAPPPPPVPSPAAERRQLTVLFCDLVDSTELASRMDPEDWRDVVRRFQQVCTEAVERFEGHVAQYLGDGLLVYFGYPLAHEDDAERAVRAGLEMHDALAELDGRLELGLRLVGRVGVHTGPVVVGEMGARQRRETLALGETTNVAARLQALAQPGTVVLSDETLRLVGGLFLTEELGRRRLRGVAEPRSVYRVLGPSGVRGRLEAAAGPWTPFVGRTEELALLRDRFERAAEGEGQTVLLEGEAGVGKSRLAVQLRESLLEGTHLWLECRSSPYAQQSPLRPVIELLEQGLGISPGDPPGTRLQALERAVKQAGIDAAAIPLLADLVGLDPPPAGAALHLSPELRRERTLDALVAWVLALGEARPVVLLVEDLHWCDPSSLELFGSLLGQIPGSRVLLILATRPDFPLPWVRPRGWTPLSLGRLRRRHARELVAGVSGESPLPEPAVEQILERADGVPLYLEELTRTALDAGSQGSPVTIPATLRDSLMARLDRLSSAKEVAQLASVLGREFAYEVLRAVAECDEAVLRHGLERLVASGLVQGRGSPPEASYAFKHSLVQETAYQSLLRSRRQALHARVAEVLAERFTERVTLQPEELARHFEEAGLPEPASRYYRRAGERATERMAHAEAYAHLTRSLELLGTVPDGAERRAAELSLQVALGTPLIASKGYGDPEVERVYARARELCQSVGESPVLFPARWGLATFYLARGDLRTSLELAEPLLALAQHADDPALLLRAHLTLGQLRFWMGELETSTAHLDQVGALYDPERHASLAQLFAGDPGVIAAYWLALVLWERGQPDRALERAEHAVGLARRVDHPFSLSNALAIGAVVLEMRREPEIAAAWAEEAAAIATRLGFAFLRALATAVRGGVFAGSRPGQGAALLEEGLGQLAATGTGVGSQYFLGLLAVARRGLGQDDAARSSLDAALALSGRQGSRFWDAELHRLRATLVSDAQARSDLGRALGIARVQGARSLELRAATDLARRLVQDGDARGAREVLAPVHATFDEGLDTQDLREARELLETLP